MVIRNLLITHVVIKFILKFISCLLIENNWWKEK